MEIGRLVDQLRRGHSAVALTLDADTYASTWTFDDRVRVEVVVRPRNDEADAPGEAINLRLADLGPAFLHEELTILRIGATDPRPFYFCAFSIVVEDGIPYLLGVRDFRSVGAAVDSTYFNAHEFGGRYEGLPGGDVLIAHAERSGIAAVNNRRKRAVGELLEERPGRGGVPPRQRSAMEVSRHVTPSPSRIGELAPQFPSCLVEEVPSTGPVRRLAVLPQPRRPEDRPGADDQGTSPDLITEIPHP